ncbi:MAG: cytochrome c [Syntrophaceae bacterium]|nr:cytochrome c [Syntrophaceae bacterium]
MLNRRTARAATCGTLLILALFPVLLVTPAIGQDGKQIYNNRCALCHGAEGDGKGIIMQIAPFGPDFWKANDDAAIAKAIVEGKGRMPAIPLSPEETRAVVEYMKSSFKK